LNGLAGALIAVGFAYAQATSASEAQSSDADSAESQPDPAETEWQPTLHYIDLPPSAAPLDNLLPFNGSVRRRT
jgi:hypothetical protein